MRLTILAAVLLLLNGSAVRAQQEVITPGNVQKVQISGQQVKISTAHAFAEITLYSPTVVRVRITRQAPADDFSYAVTTTPDPVKFNTSQNDQQLQLTTDSLQVLIRKKPFAISFRTLSGEIINEDEQRLTTSWTGTEVTTYKKMQEGERFIGLGEKTGNLDRKGNGYTNWNSDVFGYATNQDPLYASIPFYIGIHHTFSYGIFLDNTWQTDFNFGASNNRFSSFGARGGEMNYYFIHHRRMADIITSYTALTGRMPMPPLWSLGYQQNRYSYYPDTEVLRIAQTLREKKIPADGITLDIHYMDAYKLFTWNKSRFPDPLRLNTQLKEMGFHTTVIVDPGIKVEAGYPAYESGRKAGIFLKYSDGENYTGQVWPGWCHFPDFTLQAGRAWWQDQLQAYIKAGVSGIWNDMNEIATWGQKMPNNVLFHYDGHPTTHLQGHNVYGLQMVKASYEGSKAAMGKRPFLLTRAAYAGSQRYSALWTGDNRAEDDHMMLGVRLLSSLGVSGFPFTGMDVGGFTGNPSVPLYARWMQLGTFMPYFRNHTGVNTKSAEPWAFGEEVLEITRNYINLRYRLLPYLYSTFHEASETGLPVVRTLAIDHTFDPKVYDTRYQHQYNFGHAFMVAPFESNKTFGKIYFPGGKWYQLYTDSTLTGPQEITTELSMHTLPVYVKGGSIIPMQSLVQSTMEQPSDTLVMHIYNGDSSNTFVYYEDDGASFDYQKGGYYQRAIHFDPVAQNITLDQVSGNYTSRFRHIRLVLHGFDNMNRVTINGQEQALKEERWAFLTAISRFDPQGDATPADSCAVKTGTISNSSSAIKIGYKK